MEKTDKKDQYNTFLYNQIPNKIAYDKKIYEKIWSYIQEKLWKHMDTDFIEKVVFVLDDPWYEYENDPEMIKKLLKCFVPSIKKKLKIDKEHPLKDRIDTYIWNKDWIDRLIQQQYNLYKHQITTWGMISQILSAWPDTKQPGKKILLNGMVPQTQKTIIATILTLMILEEEFSK